MGAHCQLALFAGNLLNSSTNHNVMRMQKADFFVFYFLVDVVSVHFLSLVLCFNSYQIILGMCGSRVM